MKRRVNGVHVTLMLWGVLTLLSGGCLAQPVRYEWRHELRPLEEKASLDRPKMGPGFQFEKRIKQPGNPVEKKAGWSEWEDYE
jgi:hypothetical protein